MPNLTLRNIPKGVYKFLRESAEQSHRSLNAQILSILSKELNEAKRRLERRAAIADLDKLRDMVAKKYPVNYESTELIREDRDSR